MKNIKFVFVLVTVLALFISCSPSSEMKASVLSVNEYTLIDVRTPEEFSEGCISGAKNIDLRSDDFLDKISELDRSNNYLVYCRSGARSAEAHSLMKEAGFKNVTEITGGIINWQKEGHEISQSCI